MLFEGKTVEEATATGLSELGITEADAEIKVVEEPVKGLFGKLKGKAVVDVEKKANEDEKTLEFVKKIFEIMDINAKASVSIQGEKTVIDLIAEKSSEVIGFRGEVLDAIQTLAGAYLNTFRTDYKKVVVNCEGYREKREETLIKLAHKLEEKATEMKRDVILEPMSPFERRIIHTALADSDKVTTKSDGNEPNRYVVIVPNERDEFAKPYNAGRNNSNKDNHGKRGGFNKGGKNFNRGGFNKGGNHKTSGFVESASRRKSSFSFGAYLGNSLKDNK